MLLTWLGHSSFKLTTNNNKIIYIDPYADEYGYVDKADLILITHGHYDHCAKDKIKKISVDETIILTSVENKSNVNGQGMSIGDRMIIDENITIKAVAAYNKKDNYHPKEAGIGFIIEADGISIYHAGDTDLIDEMSNIKVDIMLVPVGGTYTMNAMDASKCCEMIKPKIAIPMHYGKIVGTKQDAEFFRELLSHTEIHPIIMEEGQSIQL